MVAAAAGFPKLTLPGPLSLLQAIATVVPAGRPSSETLPARLTVSTGRPIAWSGPALTVGAWFAGCTVTTTVSVAISAESSAFSRSVYTPASGNVAVVTSADGSAKRCGCSVGSMGPARYSHVVASEAPSGRPSSEAEPERVTVSVGNPMTWSWPASTAGRRFRKKPVGWKLFSSSHSLTVLVWSPGSSATTNSMLSAGVALETVKSTSS